MATHNLPVARDRTDEQLRMDWWNGLSERARELWLHRTDSGIAGAWAMFKTNPGDAFEVGLQEGRELAARRQP